MKNREIISSLLIALCLLSSCSTERADYETVHVGSRDNISNVTNHIVSIDDSLPDLHSMTTLLMAGDTLIFHDFKSTEYQFAAYDIKRNKTIGQFGKFGNGPGEIANFGAIFYDNDTQIMYGTNTNQGKYVGFYLPEAVNNPDYDVFDVFDMDFNAGNNAFLDTRYINDSTIICSLYIPDFEKHSLISHVANLSLVTGTVTRLDSIPFEKARFGVAVSPENNVIFAGDKQQDVIYIFDLDGNLQRKVIGPEFREETDSRTGYHLHSEICGDIVATIYSGTGADYRRERIILTDLFGNYIKTLEFDFDVYSIAYHPATDRLYLATSGEPQFGYLDWSKCLED